MEFAMILSGHDAPTPAPRVPAIPSESGIGLYDETSREIWKPDSESIRAALPARLRRYVKGREFLTCWFDRQARIDNDGNRHGWFPYLEINDAKGNRIETAYFALIVNGIQP